jgi:hypothetical protein
MSLHPHLAATAASPHTEASSSHTQRRHAQPTSNTSQSSFAMSSACQTQLQAQLHAPKALSMLDSAEACQAPAWHVCTRVPHCDSTCVHTRPTQAQQQQPYTAHPWHVSNLQASWIASRKHSIVYTAVILMITVIHDSYALQVRSLLLHRFRQNSLLDIHRTLIMASSQHGCRQRHAAAVPRLRGVFLPTLLYALQPPL